MTLKESIYNACMLQVETNVKRLYHDLHELKLQASNETKSTAGDKHETALAMLQIEQEKTNRQLQEALLQKQFLQRLDISLAHKTCAVGSLVIANDTHYFLSIAIGKLVVNNVPVIVLSPQSPLGKCLLQKAVHDHFIWQGKQFLIQHIV